MAFFGKTLTAKTATTTTTAVTNPQPTIQQVDVEALMGALSTTGTAKLSDFSTPVDTTPKVDTPKVEEPKTAAPTPAPKAETKTDKKDKTQREAPKDAFEAKQRIEQMIADNLVTLETGTDTVTFKGQTYRMARELRMLGGDFNRDTNLWSVPSAAWFDPSTATATKSERQQKREERNAESEAEIQKRIDAAVAEALKTATPEGMITIDAAKQNTRKAIELLLQNLSKMNPTALEAIVTKVYAA